MSEQFLICLRRILQNECGYPQPDGPPWVRLRNGATWDHHRNLLVLPNGTTRGLPTRPDGFAYDDDPDDTGGRTCMGVLQRVYDAHRKRKALATQDVWLISDQEIIEIYYNQYWLPLRARELPLAVALSTFDHGVNAGIGIGAKVLQRALGVTADGHVGNVTIAAADNADQVDLVARIHAERDNYYRQCKTYWKHGPGWLKRSARTAEWSHDTIGADAPGTWTVETTETARTPRAADAPTDSMVQSSEGNAAVTVGTGGTGTIAVEGVRAAKELSKQESPGLLDFLLILAQSEIFWLGVVTVVGAAFIWTRRRARLRFGT